MAGVLTQRNRIGIRASHEKRKVGEAEIELKQSCGLRSMTMLRDGLAYGQQLVLKDGLAYGQQLVGR